MPYNEYGNDYCEQRPEELWDWINANFVPREDVTKEKIELLKSIPVGLFDSTPYVEAMIEKLTTTNPTGK